MARFVTLVPCQRSAAVFSNFANANIEILDGEFGEWTVASDSSTLQSPRLTLLCVNDLSGCKVPVVESKKAFTIVLSQHRSSATVAGGSSIQKNGIIPT